MTSDDPQGGVKTEFKAALQGPVTGAIAGNVMLIAFALYGGHFHGMEPIFRRVFGGASAV